MAYPEAFNHTGLPVPGVNAAFKWYTGVGLLPHHETDYDNQRQQCGVPANCHRATSKVSQNSHSFVIG